MGSALIFLFHLSRLRSVFIAANKPGKHSIFSSINEPTADEFNILRQAYVPWIIIENRDRYPFLWGRGTLDMYSA